MNPSPSSDDFCPSHEEANHLPTPPAVLFDLFEQVQIRHHTIRHPPLFTVQQSKELRGEIEGHHVKNLFVKDKKSRLFLITARESCVIDLKTLHGPIGGQGRLSFCSADQLMTHLGVEPGSVTPLSLINDKTRQVQLVLDDVLLNGERINVHPLINTMTTGLSREGFLAFLALTGHKPLILSGLAQSSAEHDHGPK